MIQLSFYFFMLGAFRQLKLGISQRNLVNVTDKLEESSAVELKIWSISLQQTFKCNPICLHPKVNKSEGRNVYQCVNLAYVSLESRTKRLVSSN